MNNTTLLQGRLVSISGKQVQIQTQAGPLSTLVSNPHAASLGDLVKIHDNTLFLLTPNRHPKKSVRLMHQILDPRRIQNLQIRAKIEKIIFHFFEHQDFTPVRTPTLVPCPGMEPHIRPFKISNHSFLPTSPEFAMKRLLVGGLEKIFQLCSAFRDEPYSNTHLPEFTLLEWYRAYSGYEKIMADTESLIETIALQLNQKPVIQYQSQTISVKTPWPRLAIKDLFKDHAGIVLSKTLTHEQLQKECARLGLTSQNVHTGSQQTWDDLYFQIWFNVIEPNLPKDRAVFVYQYPASQAALATLEKDSEGNDWARRFEAYAGGLELCNAFEELTDPTEQRRRFVEDMNLRERIYGPSFPKNPIDEDFLSALEEGMPPSGGNALGVDRLVMLFANETDIRYTTWLSD